jgi:hypothetical protein
VARKTIVFLNSDSTRILTEMPADNEAQLRDLIKDHPDLIPIDDFGMTGPLMVVGRETTLPSGGIDLVGIARGGELLLLEFKTGPQNTDFRHVLAQLLDYGSDLWRLSYEEFETTIAARYFASSYCQDPRVRGQTDLLAAARATWPDLSDEEASHLHDRLVGQLDAGSFHYIVAAQRFTSTVGRAHRRIPQRRRAPGPLLRRRGRQIRRRRHLGLRGPRRPPSVRPRRRPAAHRPHQRGRFPR